MAEGWVVIYRCNDLNTAEIVKSFLLDNDINAVIVNKMDSMHLHLSNGDIEIHVKQNEVIQAKYLLSKTDL